MTAPYLSIVITARHDNYGGDFRERIAAPLRFNDERLSDRGVPYEVMLVEWDPIAGRPLLCDMLAKELPDIAERVFRPIVVASSRPSSAAPPAISSSAIARPFIGSAASTRCIARPGPAST